MNNEQDQMDPNDHGGCLADSLPSVAPAALKAGEMRVISGTVILDEQKAPRVFYAVVLDHQFVTPTLVDHNSRAEAEAHIERRRREYPDNAPCYLLEYTLPPLEPK